MVLKLNCKTAYLLFELLSEKAKWGHFYLYLLDMHPSKAFFITDICVTKQKSSYSYFPYTCSSFVHFQVVRVTTKEHKHF